MTAPLLPMIAAHGAAALLVEGRFRVAVRLEPGGPLRWLEPQGVLTVEVLGGSAAHGPWEVPDLSRSRIEVNAAQAVLTAATALSGFPPLLSYAAAGVHGVATDPATFAEAFPERPLSLDLEGVREHFTYGYPIGGRTLFAELRLIEPASALVLSNGAAPQRRSLGSLEQVEILANRDYVESLQARFLGAAARLDPSDTVLSLSGGLDSRCVLAACLAQGLRLPVASQSGSPRTADARIAERIAGQLGLEFQLVEFDEAFRARLPEFALEAARLCGGLASIVQAHEVHFNRELKGPHRYRVSGNGGNQVGRLCLEGVSIRGADLAVLDGIAAPTPDRPLRHWAFDQVPAEPRRFLQGLVWKELQWPILANHWVASGYRAQLMPYLDPEVLRGAACNPEIARYSKQFGPRQARLRDLRHRVTGLPIAGSWQRQLLVRHGGTLADIPLNLGWYPGRSASLRSLAGVTGSLIDLYTYQPRRGGATLRRLSRLLGSAGQVNTTDYKAWTRQYLRDFCNDLIRSRSVSEAGVFRQASLLATFDRYFGGGDTGAFPTVVAAVDVALAQQLFVDRTALPSVGAPAP